MNVGGRFLLWVILAASGTAWPAWDALAVLPADAETASVESASVERTIDRFMQKESPQVRYPEPSARLLVSASAALPLIWGGPSNLSVDVAWRWQAFHVFGLAERGSGAWGTIHAEKTPDELVFPPADPASDASSEYSRARSQQDSWNWTSVGLGAGVESKIFSSWTSRLVNRARISLLRSWLEDEANALSFDAWLFRAEVVEAWLVNPAGSVRLFVGANWTFGNSVTEFEPWRTVASRSLPVRYFSLITGLSYSF